MCTYGCITRLISHNMKWKHMQKIREKKRKMRTRRTTRRRRWWRWWDNESKLYQKEAGCKRDYWCCFGQPHSTQQKPIESRINCYNGLLSYRISLKKSFTHIAVIVCRKRLNCLIQMDYFRPLDHNGNYSGWARSQKQDQSSYQKVKESKMFFWC